MARDYPDILILGGGGFVGKAFREECCRLGVATAIVERESLRSSISSKRLENCCVVDFAAPNPANSPPGFDYLASARVLHSRLAEFYDALRPRFVFHLSSSRVFGSSPSGRISQRAQVSPDCLYGESKVLAERFYGDLAKIANTTVLSARAPAIVGANCHSNFLVKIARAFLAQQELICASKDSPYNAVVDVSELSRFIIKLCCTVPDAGGFNAINLASPIPIRIGSLLSIASNIFGKKMPDCVFFDDTRHSYVFEIDRSDISVNHFFSETERTVSRFFKELSSNVDKRSAALNRFGET
jgi:nucleoside-diphosphate-sugar epimerase